MSINKNYIFAGIGVLIGTAGGFAGGYLVGKKKFSGKKPEVKEVVKVVEKEAPKKNDIPEPVAPVVKGVKGDEGKKETKESTDDDDDDHHGWGCLTAEMVDRELEPFIISEREAEFRFGNCPTESLIYYQADGVLVQEDDTPLFHPELIVGSEALWELEQTSEERMFVYNPERITKYDIRVVSDAEGPDLFPTDDDDEEEEDE